MHDQSIIAMNEFLKDIDYYPFKSVLDVGSLRIGKSRTYRELIPHHWYYQGLDIVPGDNVDVIAKDPYNYPLVSESWDVVISGQAIEHVSDLFRWSAELYRVLKPGGRICVIGPSTGPIHHKLDYWRILPDGMTAVLVAGGFENITITPYGDCRWHTIRGTARKGE